jgi:hypothetical protein
VGWSDASGLCRQDGESFADCFSRERRDYLNRPTGGVCKNLPDHLGALGVTGSAGYAAHLKGMGFGKGFLFAAAFGGGYLLGQHAGRPAAVAAASCANYCNPQIDSRLNRDVSRPGRARKQRYNWCKRQLSAFGPSALAQRPYWRECHYFPRLYR